MPADPAHSHPSARQQEVMDLLVQGMTNKEIGQLLGMATSARVVYENHRVVL